MADNDLQRKIDTSLMIDYCKLVNGLSEDIEAIAKRVRKINPDLPLNSCTDLVYDFVRSSQAVRDYARKEKDSGRKMKSSVWDYHLFGFKEYEQKWAWAIHHEKQELGCDGAWGLAQDKIAEIILGKYKKVKLSGSIDRDDRRF